MCSRSGCLCVHVSLLKATGPACHQAVLLHRLALHASPASLRPSSQCAMLRTLPCSTKAGIGSDKAATVYDSLFKRRMAGGRAVA